MMPWEHAAIGYVVYSLFVHAAYRAPPTGRETLVVVFASILPDLIDKPLAWQFHVFDGGRALGHSIFFATSLSLAVLMLAYNRGRPKLGMAFSFGYLLHLPADVFPSYLQGGDPSWHVVLWPINGGGGQHESFTAGFLDNFTEYVGIVVTELASGDPSPYVLLLVGLAILTVVLWIYDGMPILRELYFGLQRVLNSSNSDS